MNELYDIIGEFFRSIGYDDDLISLRYTASLILTVIMSFAVFLGNDFIETKKGWILMLGISVLLIIIPELFLFVILYYMWILIKSGMKNMINYWQNLPDE